MMTLLQSAVEDGLRGRVFAAFGVAEAAASLVGTAMAASLADRFGVFTVLTAQGAGYVVAGLAFVLVVRAATRRKSAAVVLPDIHVTADPKFALAANQRRRGC
jgi:hypothetical protein